MDETNLTNNIQSSLSLGQTKEQIYANLLNQGYSIETIQSNFKTLETEEHKEDISKQTVRIIVTIGALLIGAGIFSLIAANWQYIPKINKIIIIITSMLISYTLGWILKEKSHLDKTGEALILLGSIIFGGGIFLVGQMFNIRTNWPDGFILWMIGTVFMGFAINSYAILALSIALGFIALIGHPFELFTGSKYNSFLFTSSLLLLFTTALTYTSGLIIRKRIPPEFKDFY